MLWPTNDWKVETKPNQIEDDSAIVVNFYPRDAMLARVFATATCPSVRPSVHLLHPGIVSIRRKVAAWFLHLLVAPCTILVFWCQISSRHSKGFPELGPKQGSGGKIQPFSSFKHQSWIIVLLYCIVCLYLYFCSLLVFFKFFCVLFMYDFILNK